MKNRSIADLYPELKQNGLFYLTVGSLISSDNQEDKETWQQNLRRLKELLAAIPDNEVKERQAVQRGIEIVKHELSKFD